MRRTPSNVRRIVAAESLRDRMFYCTVTLTGADGMPFATTTSWLGPVSIDDGTWKYVDTGVGPVATPMVLKLRVLQ